ncbi:hypothetical protein IQ235_16865 [Oscillatoriales cyanobacterium LEGE 11467]|uniref:Uncharacterized protein n=1 Tax=Zarconia navalis LEGE 11467 TaxID=1828826 RepID=A0A928Z9A6_9CYAN|nr:hypothetical protein [Zarconia navalis]MBE9042445.1 hypothetical protein [Zarconia navalis LEGE 11467]
MPLTPIGHLSEAQTHETMDDADGILARSNFENPWRLIRHVRFWTHRDRDPVMASRKQHSQRSDRLEFTVQTYQYATASVLSVNPSVQSREPTHSPNLKLEADRACIVR